MTEIERLQRSLIQSTLPVVRVKDAVASFRPVADADLLRAMLNSGEPFIAEKIREHRERTTYIHD